MRLLVGCIVHLAALGVAAAWSVPVRNSPAILAAGAGGGVFAAIPIWKDGSFDVVKIDGRAGRRLWRRRIHSPVRGEDAPVNALLPTGRGDAIIAGAISLRKHGRGMMVARLAGRDGHEVWRWVLLGHGGPDRSDEATNAALDLDGDVIVGGGVEDFGERKDTTVVKLAGATGAVRWRFVSAAPFASGSAGHVAADGRGDVIVQGGFVSGLVTRAAVVKLDGGTGTLRWRWDDRVFFRVDALALDPAGDVCLAGSIYDGGGTDFAVVKLAGDTGAELWRARESASHDRFEDAYQLLVDPSGDVFAGGLTDDASGTRLGYRGQQFAVVRFDGATGRRVWAYHTHGSDGEGHLFALARGPAGTVLGGGFVRNGTTCDDGYVVALAADSGAVVWSRTLDGRFALPSCDPLCFMGECEAVDNDVVSALALGPGGRVIAGGELLNGARRHPRWSAFVRMLPRVRAR